MIDYFALLQQPRRPWLDAEELKQKYHQLAAQAHPDRQSIDSKNPNTDFARLNVAYRVLLDPKLRLHHLLSLEGMSLAGDKDVLDKLGDLFAQTGTFIHEVDRLLKETKEANSALSKSLLQSEILEKQSRTKDLLDRLNMLYQGALQELQALDRIWSGDRQQVLSAMRDMYQRLAYLTRWISQIEERQFQLSI
jgi:curved DNA-binding protein CbpA